MYAIHTHALKYKIYCLLLISEAGINTTISISALAH